MEVIATLRKASKYEKLTAPTGVRTNEILNRDSDAARCRLQVLFREPMRNRVVPSNTPQVQLHPSTVYERIEEILEGCEDESEH